jgi:hypothetical protein
VSSAKDIPLLFDLHTRTLPLEQQKPQQSLQVVTSLVLAIVLLSPGITASAAAAAAAATTTTVTAAILHRMVPLNNEVRGTVLSSNRMITVVGSA